MSEPPPPPVEIPAPPPRESAGESPSAGADLPGGQWGAGRAFLGLVILLFVVAGEAIIVSVFDPEIESLAARLVLQVLLAGSLIVVALVAASPPGGGLAPARLLGLRKPTGPVIGPTLIAYFAYIGCAVVIAALLEPEQEDVTRELGVDEGLFGAIAAGVLIIGAAPLSEEIFFRGFMFAGLRRSAGFLIGAIVSAVIWGLFHYTGPDSLAVCLQLALFGVALAWLYERTGSLWPPIAVHTFNNALAFTLLTS